ncbi:hypothetical protein P691DRAFT_783330 [Macrolepiota fuliginosa MF-IS2]|uniref:C2H2-type domain-containing protein n=1 Tax=Macrolepiota fuliginosa MF-IS2 TaxID=1400762 RepID=A0A9P6C924_9AGAR|nr:hypothetical protein P691DRAFT_783330 [Macrolepiota fuliginosa MF-IS2]
MTKGSKFVLAQALAAAQAAANAELNLEEEEEEEEEEDEGEDEDEGEAKEDEAGEMEEEEEDEDDAEIDAEAQEIVRRLGQQLWEDITKAQAAQAASAVASVLHPAQKQSRKAEAVILTMKTILSLVEQDLAAKAALESTLLPGNAGNVLGILQQSVLANNVAKQICMPLSHTVVSLAKSEVLFGGLRHSNIPSIELDKGKRRREEGDEFHNPSDHRPLKRPYILEGDLYTQVSEAVRVITQALGNAPPQTLDPALVASIRLQLHQVFLFAVTSSARGGHEMHALQEISGLIQVVGVLSGIQIGQPPETLPNQLPYITTTSYPWMNQPYPFSPPTDIGTAVYPCLFAGCGKTFSRLYSLRAHQRGHATHRPFRCTICPASFARNHDLKRHVRLHDKKAWKCGGCQKIFSRRDAIKRHKNGSKTRGPKSEICINADVVEVDLDEEDGEDSLREERRAKLWNSIAANGVNPPQGHYRDTLIMEEGEVPPTVIANTQAVVLSLQGLLQSHVGSALGTPHGPPVLVNSDPTNGQATLASVIARAQLQSLPMKQAPVTDAGGNVAPMPISSSLASTPPVDNAGLQDVAMAPPNPADQNETPIIPSLSMYGLSDEQAKMLELAIASAASAAQAQAEAEAALEEEEEEEKDSSEDDSDNTDDQEMIT